jgi:hypothetical protein
MGLQTNTEVREMHTMRSRAIAAAIAGAVLVGGAIGATAFSASPSNAASTTGTTPAAAGNPPSGAPAGKFKPNEATSHEGGESKAREAQEDAGQRPTVP